MRGPKEEFRLDVPDPRDRARLLSLGLADPSCLRLALPGRPVAFHRRREVHRIADASPAWFAKRDRPPGHGGTRLRRWRHERTREWERLQRLEASAVPVSRPVAFALSEEAALLVTEELAGIPLFEACRVLSVAAVGEALARLLEQLREASFLPKDLLAKHVWIEPGTPCRAAILDVARGHEGRPGPAAEGAVLGRLVATLPARTQEPWPLERLLPRRAPLAVARAALRSLLAERRRWAGLRARTREPAGELFDAVLPEGRGLRRSDAVTEEALRPGAPWPPAGLRVEAGPRRDVMRAFEAASQWRRLGGAAGLPVALLLDSRGMEAALLVPEAAGAQASPLEELRDADPGGFGLLLGECHAAGLSLSAVLVREGRPCVPSWLAFSERTPPSAWLRRRERARWTRGLGRAARGALELGYADGAADPLSLALKELAGSSGTRR